MCLCAAASHPLSCCTLVVTNCCVGGTCPSVHPCDMCTRVMCTHVNALLSAILRHGGVLLCCSCMPPMASSCRLSSSSTPWSRCAFARLGMRCRVSAVALSPYWHHSAARTRMHHFTPSAHGMPSCIVVASYGLYPTTGIPCSAASLCGLFYSDVVQVPVCVHCKMLGSHAAGPSHCPSHIFPIAHTLHGFYSALPCCVASITVPVAEPLCPPPYSILVPLLVTPSDVWQRHALLCPSPCPHETPHARGQGRPPPARYL